MSRGMPGWGLFILFFPFARVAADATTARAASRPSKSAADSLLGLFVPAGRRREGREKRPALIAAS
jgi:hypothetical protein